MQYFNTLVYVYGEKFCIEEMLGHLDDIGQGGIALNIRMGYESTSEDSEKSLFEESTV